MTGRELLEEVKHARQHLSVLKDELREQRSMLDGIRAIVYDGIHAVSYTHLTLPTILLV